MNKTIEKPNNWASLLFFTVVPESYLLLFFITREHHESELSQVAESLGMSAGQRIFFEILLVLLYSAVIFLVAYFISLLVMGWFSDKVQKDKLFIAFVLATAFTNLISTVLFELFRYSSGISLAIVQVLLLIGFYAGFTKIKDLKGTIVLGIVNVLFGIVPILLTK